MTGPELALARESLGWSALQLARLLGVHHSALARIEASTWDVVPPEIERPMLARMRAAERNPIPRLRG